MVRHPRGGHTLRKDFRRTVRQSLPRFLSLLLIVMLAVLFFVGLRATAPSMRKTASSYFEEQRLFDLRLVSTLGLEQADLTAVAAIEGVDQVMGAQTADVYVESAGQTKVIRIHSLAAAPDEALNQPLLIDGRWPETRDEILIDGQTAEFLDYRLGQELVISLPDDSLFEQEQVTIVGTAMSPYYITGTAEPTALGSGSIDSWAYAPQTAFNEDVFTELFVTVDHAGAESYSDAYAVRVDPVQLRLEDEAPTIVAGRRERIVGEAEAAIREGELELADARAEAEDEFISAKADIDSGFDDWTAGLAEYAAGRQAYEDGEAEGRAELEDARAVLDESREELTRGQAEFDAEEGDALAELAAAERQLTEGQAALEAGRAAYEQGLADWAAGQAELDVNAALAADGRAQYEAGQAEYESGLAAYESGLARFISGIQAQDPEAGVTDLVQARSWYETRLTELTAAQAQVTEGLGALEASEMQLQLAWEAGLVTDEAYQTQLAEIAAVRAELLDTQAQIDAGLAGLTGLEAGLLELEGAGQELDASRVTLDTAKLEVEEAERQIAAGQAELDRSRVQLDQAAATLAGEEERLEAGWLAYEAGVQELDAARQALVDGWDALEAGEADYEAGLAEFEAELAAARADLEAGWTEIEEGQTRLNAGKAQYEAGRFAAESRFAEAEEEISDAWAEVRTIDAGKALVLDRDTNPGVYSFGMDAERMANISAFIPVIFFVVAGMISLTAMTRMVESDRTLIGMERALGYRLSGLMWKYVGYALLAAGIGGLLGVVLSPFLPWVIFNSYAILYTLPPMQLALHPLLAAAGIGAAALSLLVGVVLAAVEIMRSRPAQLMRPPAPRIGRAIWLERIRPLWKRLSFSYKVAMRNLFRYKKRLFMTLFGISGCTGLLLLGFGLRNSINSIMPRQYGDIYHHDAAISVSDDFDPGGEEAAALDALLAELPGETIRLYNYEETISVSSDGLEGSRPEVSLTIPRSGSLTEMVTLRERRSQEPLSPTDGVIITEKLSRLLDVEAGDVITLMPYQGVSGSALGDAVKLVTETVDVKVTGVTEAYVGHTLYISPELAGTLLGRVPEPSRLYIRNDEAFLDFDRTKDRLAGPLLDIDGIREVSFVADAAELYTDSLDRLQIVVYIIVIAAGALAVLVLYNLNTINISERRRELATLRVLGFTDREMLAYIYRENFFLTLLGIALGLILGVFLNNYILATVEMDMMYFSREIHWTSYLLAIGLTMLFSLGVNISMSKAITNIDMVESLKSVE